MRHPLCTPLSILGVSVAKISKYAELEDDSPKDLYDAQEHKLIVRL